MPRTWLLSFNPLCDGAPLLTLSEASQVAVTHTSFNPLETGTYSNTEDVNGFFEFIPFQSPKTGQPF
jgi:hypothetical protein